MAPSSENEPHKRKRDISDESGTQSGLAADRIPQPLPPQSAKQPPINYLSRAQSGRLSLLQGDSDSFSDVLALIGEYEGVLNRHESLAVNLGAKLTGPRLLKAMEGLFEGPIIANPRQAMFGPDPITWLDIVEFSRSHPGDFVISNNAGGIRCCQFQLKGAQVEISEDDWRLIVAGAVDRFRLQQPAEEDEMTEAATLDILEQRLQVLIKKADEVARKARQLNYHLGGRKAAINARRSSQSSSSKSPFQAANQLRPGAAGPTYDLHADLLAQFMNNPHQSRLSSTSSVPPTPVTASTSVTTPRTSLQYIQQPQHPQQQQQHQQSQPSTAYSAASGRPSPVFSAESSAREPDEEYRHLVTSVVEKLGRGETIYPPCDRCRRLRTQCVKHLTACQGCTKKHARCVWKGLTEEEVVWLRGQVGSHHDDESDSRVTTLPRVPDDPRETVHLATPSHDQQQIQFSDSRDRSNEAAPSGQLVSRLAIGRHVDDVWRKGNASTSSPYRHENMDIDTREPAKGDGGRPHSRLSHLTHPTSAPTPSTAASPRHNGQGYQS
ncbi:uncharacterized protein B0I36DRAFT_37292 [Microdochium trichocladiopsis]|uniref:Zn(2)-C6 fungal-type domain-containing protein n=1 Tax=Microdochium trichocladiopsis TaxID=1682393 RepID=A0A9P9BMY3_9PEZI|nr:uncharacterized protein B0I36DRAFT_37292 [Microdochium trichocladiopsis]KAH7018272.1 hypothetical protein B0I36DRAFT_37292 [Microdochium trichocladiopsis]